MRAKILNNFFLLCQFAKANCRVLRRRYSTAFRELQQAYTRSQKKLKKMLILNMRFITFREQHLKLINHEKDFYSYDAIRMCNIR